MEFYIPVFRPLYPPLFSPVCCGRLAKMFSNLKPSRGLQSIFNISDRKNIVRVDQILILGLKSGARSQQLLSMSTVKIKTGKDGRADRVTKFSKIFKKSSRVSPRCPRVCRINLKKKGAATRVRPKINLVESFDKLEFQRVST